MAKTISQGSRNSMLNTLVSNASWLELVTNGYAGEDTEDGTLGVHEITFEDASGGSVVQDGTISFTFGYTSQDTSTSITGFKVFTDRQLVEGEDFYEGTGEIMEGEFTEATTINLDGTEYTINISGITVTLPESGE